MEMSAVATDNPVVPTKDRKNKRRSPKWTDRIGEISADWKKVLFVV